MEEAQKILSFTDVIKLWPSFSAMGRDLGVGWGTVQQWSRRDRIPAEYWNSIIAAAKARGYHGITEKLLCNLAETRQLRLTA